MIQAVCVISVCVISFKGIALKVYIILPCLMLQKPPSTSKARDHTDALRNRLRMWNEGNFMEILREGTIIQQRIDNSSKRSSNPEDLARILAKLMFEGKVNAAMKLIDKNSDSGVLPGTDEVINLLKEKHPGPGPVDFETLMKGPLQPPSNAHFFEINEASIFKAAMHTRGAGGPSQFDADQHRHVLCSKRFKSEGKELRDAIALFAKKIATEVTDPRCLEAYVACRLIPLNKNPGVRPIGVGEVLRRIVGKSIAWSLKKEVQLAAGPLQMSTGLQGGAEAAIHAMKEIFCLDTTDAVVLVDASNAFNNLNRNVALNNIQYICPPIATTLINTYRFPSRLILPGGREIVSQEGTTQGDPLAMQFYALGMKPLIDTLRDKVPAVTQVWLADDATGAGSLDHLKEWWLKLIAEGERLGYFVNESKSWLIVKNAEDLQRVKNVFEGSRIQFSSCGQPSGSSNWLE